ncbi:RNA polymerase sigma factor [Luteimonas salinisoli]|uniref:RNA polymerase sigma factor n=1 Tax=Luteimonas salinisoli TaxID=2752307 RepID=UPI001C5CBC6B
MSGTSPRTESEQAFEQLNRRFRPGLMAFFLRRLGNHAEAEDLTQEVFIRLAGVDAARVQSAEAYIFQMAANLLRDRSRREKVRFDYRAEAMVAADAGVDLLDPLRVAADRESLAGLAAALGELPGRARTIFILYRLENVDKRDIAQAFEISLSTVERELTRVMAHLTRRVRGSG